ncbi:hypothetical protein [Embleya sp. NPDC059259]|uniref:hypothetical protein n=1 Tax=unclassified Embleya TaxID=2699296 RepID=UPI0036B8B40D
MTTVGDGTPNRAAHSTRGPTTARPRTDTVEHMVGGIGFVPVSAARIERGAEQGG